jgi:hypothetical protein
MKPSLMMSTAATIIAGAGCSTVPTGKTTVPPKQGHALFPTATAAAVSPGVVVSTPVAYAGSGNVAICVQWTASQVGLNNKAQWWIGTKKYISSTGVFATGTYTVTFGPCSVAGYTPPPPKTISMPTANKKVTLTVTYGHQ